MEDRNVTININGGMAGFAKDNATIIATQSNGVSAKELDTILQGIRGNLSNLKQEDADGIIHVVDMVKAELSKPEPKTGILKNCLTLIAPMFTIANGIPTLTDNLQKLVNYITPFIK